MHSARLFRMVGILVASGCLAACAGCRQTYWVATPDLNQARQLQPGTPPESIAVRASTQPRDPPVDARYLRVSTTEIAAAAPGPIEPFVKVHAPDKRGKLIGGAVLLGLGGALVLGGIGMIGYGISITKRDSLGAGIVAGLSGIPLGVGIPLGIAGGVLLGRSRGPSDVVPPGQPDVTYLPPLR